MAANGAGGDTLKQFEDALGRGMSIDNINQYTHSFLKKFPNEDGVEINAVNSIWFDKGVQPNKGFLQSNLDYFNADMFKVDFKDESGAVDIVNMWAKDKTNGIIENAIEEIDKDATMLLINTMMFDGEWLLEDFKHNVEKASFYMADNLSVMAEYMNSTLSYISNERATGFICPYKKDYSFIALLPNIDITIDEYTEGLSSEEFSNVVDFETDKKCVARMPKFKYEYNVEMKDSIENMGINGNDFSNMWATAIRGETKIGSVYSSAKIEVNEERTIAGVSSTTAMITRSGASEVNYVTLNRPFVYAIVENDSKIPLFIGTVNSIEGETYETEWQPKGLFTSEDEVFQYELFDGELIGAISKYIGEAESVVLPNIYAEDGLQYWINNVRDNAFNGNDIIKNITVENVFWYLGDNAFANCRNLENIYFYEDVSEIGKDIFKGSDKLVIHCRKSSEIYKYALANKLKIEIIAEKYS